MKLTTKFVVLLLGLLCTDLAYANNRLIIKYKPTQAQSVMLSSGKISKFDLVAQQMKPYGASQITRLSKLAGMKVRDDHAIGTGAHVIILEHDVDAKTMQKIIDKIAKEPNVKYIEEDRLMYPTSNPTLNPVQWDMESVSHSNTWYGANFTGAWSFLDNQSLVPGESVVVAVIDTGYTPHPNILANLEPLSVGSNQYGYQFISDCRTAGSCPSSTPSNEASIAPTPNGLDLGDYLTQAQINASNGYFSNKCLRLVSIWHGTHVAGTVVATGYDGESGVLGGAYGAKVVPVRVLGKCGGSTSDVEDGLVWAANEYPGISNSNPAQVISMSLGGSGQCPDSFQDAIDQVSPAILVVAAGNSKSDVSTTSPANCANVISVSALGPLNQLAEYSNFGATTIAAPGGDFTTGSVGTSGGVYSTVWGSPESYDPSSGGDFDYYEGTSMATPHVSAAVADIIGVLKSKHESWSETQIVQILQNSASTDFNPCSNFGCATQLKLDVESALMSADYYHELVPSTNSVVFNSNESTQAVSFSNSSSGAVNIASYSVNPSDSRLSINASDCVGQTLAVNSSCNVIFTFTQSLTTNSKATNLNASESTSVAFQLIDSHSLSVATVVLALPAAESTPTPTPTPTTSSSGGGGCAMVQTDSDFSLLILMCLVSMLYLYRTKNNYSRSVESNEKHGGESK